MGKFSIALNFFDLLNMPLFSCWSDLVDTNFGEVFTSSIITCRIRKFPLPPGQYQIMLALVVRGVLQDKLLTPIIDVVAGDFFGSGKLPSLNLSKFYVEHSWNIDEN